MFLPDKNRVIIREMVKSDCDRLAEMAVGHVNMADYFSESFSEQIEGKRLVFLSFFDGALAGYVHYNRFPVYQPFRSLAIPEIQDLYVLPDYRRHGIGQALIDVCEKQAGCDGKSDIGIGVGVATNFGAAQRLYARRGYVPDGAGVVFDRGVVSVGEVRPVDDRLCLMLMKPL